MSARRCASRSAWRTPAADHTICLTFSDAIPEPPRGAAQSGPVYRWQEGGARHLLQRYSVAGKTPQFTCAVTRGARTDVTFAESYRAGASVRAVLEAAGLFDIFADAGMLVLHSAYIVTRGGEGILFSGPSGIGQEYAGRALGVLCRGADGQR